MASTSKDKSAATTTNSTGKDEANTEAPAAMLPPPKNTSPPATAPKINDPPLTTDAINALTPKLNAILSSPATCPLLLLKDLIDTLVSAPAPVTCYHVGCLFEAITASDLNALTVIPRLPHAAIAASFYTEMWGLWSHRLVTALVLVLAASPPFVPTIHRRFKELGRQGGMVDFSEVRQFESCDLRTQFEHAVGEAERKGRTT
ncbi:MAG: hypothetical protein Q9207_007795, partial [Kuettlingeria erythrocarpa]